MPGLERVVVVGSGLTAAPIAAALAAAPDTDVALAARDAARTGAAARKASALAGRAVAALPLAAASFADAELVVETISEDLDAKRGLYAQVEPWLADDAVLATNTSSLPLAELGAALAHPDRLAGLHFLHPAHATAVVEVVAGPATRPQIPVALADLVVAAGRTPIALRREVPGLVWNRLQFALLRECLHLLDEGVADVEAIDAAISDGLAPRWMATGPFATADLGGLETFARVGEQLFAQLADGAAAASALRARADDGFYPAWTKAERERIERLRGDALAAGARIARERRAATGAGRARG